jgi:ribosomal protein S6--L-glutamate ligase
VKRVCFLLERGNPPRLNPIIAEVFERLRAQQVDVTVRFPEEELIELDTFRVDADLYVLKSNTELALSLATAYERIGARVLNNARASAVAKDKLLAAAVLARAGIPAPRSLAAARPDQLADSFDGGRALILKPHRGFHGAGVAVAERPSELPAANVYPEVVFAQEYLARARRDLKLFAIGEDVFGVRKAFAPDSYLRTGEPTPLPPEIEQIARRCGAAFGLELYGLDVAEDPEVGPRVIDVNYFPGYRGVPRAAERMTEYIARAVRQT